MYLYLGITHFYVFDFNFTSFSWFLCFGFRFKPILSSFIFVVFIHVTINASWLKITYVSGQKSLTKKGG